MRFAMDRIARLALGCVLGLFALQANAASEVFPEGEFVSPQVNFWTNIFQSYPSSTMLIHDAFYPDAVVDILDFKRIGKALGNDRVKTRRLREQMAEKYVKRYNVALQRFKQLHHGATRYGAMEERIYKVYRKDPRMLRSLYLGEANLRAQSGLADEFQEAARRAQKFLPQMERIFADQGIPKDLTRIAFVESMFNLDARSKVGASGVWQFMPGTAREYMFVNHFIDERNSPLKATRAAARLLADNFAELRSWPLAVTAYNHGRGGMKRAVRQVGTTDLNAIARQYRSSSFGFASRNFYAEFLAARKTYNEYYVVPANDSSGAATKAITLSKPISVAQLISLTPLDQEQLRRHNPCLLSSAFTTYKYRPLPLFYQINVPNSIADQVKVAINRIPAAPMGRRRS